MAEPSPLPNLRSQDNDSKAADGTAPSSQSPERIEAPPGTYKACMRETANAVVIDLTLLPYRLRAKDERTDPVLAVNDINEIRAVLQEAVSCGKMILLPELHDSLFGRRFMQEVHQYCIKTDLPVLVEGYNEEVEGMNKWNGFTVPTAPQVKGLGDGVYIALQKVYLAFSIAYNIAKHKRAGITTESHKDFFASEHEKFNEARLALHCFVTGMPELKALVLGLQEETIMAADAPLGPPVRVICGIVRAEANGGGSNSYTDLTEPDASAFSLVYEHLLFAMLQKGSFGLQSLLEEFTAGVTKAKASDDISYNPMTLSFTMLNQLRDVVMAKRLLKEIQQHPIVFANFGFDHYIPIRSLIDMYYERGSRDAKVGGESEESRGWERWWWR